MKLYYCKHCKNIIAYVKENNPNIICCGEKMQELVPGTVDASKEKHIPVIEQEGQNVTVTVGSVVHPMEDVHYIEWIILQTNKGVYRKNLKPGMAPVAKYVLEEDEEVIAAYEYCNLHGFWKK